MTETLSLFPVLHDKLILLLKSLSKEGWNKPIIAKLWTVNDFTGDGHLAKVVFSLLAVMA